MAAFEMITVAEIMKRGLRDLYEEAFVINDRYFTVDTATRATIDAWEEHNGHITTCALWDGHVEGFFNVMPITDECADLFEREELREEDLDITHILSHDQMPRAKAAYFAAIAVKDTHSYISRQCAAAMLSVIASLMLHGYPRGTFKKLYANPTTFLGNELIRRLGLKPLVPHGKPLKANDIYALEMTDETLDWMAGLEKRYARFIGTNPWAA